MPTVTVPDCDDGVGLELSSRNVILDIEKGSAADRSGVFLLGDRVLGVDGELLGSRELCDVICPASEHTFELERETAAPDSKRRRLDNGAPAVQQPPPSVTAVGTSGTDGAARSAMYTSLGSRASQEDAYTVVDDGWIVVGASEGGENGHGADASVAREAWPPCRFYGVFDGHNGDAASQLASRMVWAELQPALVAHVRATSSVPTDQMLRTAVRAAFHSTEEAVLRDAGECGSTAVCVLLIGDTLCVANLGDSRAVLCRAEVGAHPPRSPVARRAHAIAVPHRTSHALPHTPSPHALPPTPCRTLSHPSAAFGVADRRPQAQRQGGG